MASIKTEGYDPSYSLATRQYRVQDGAIESDYLSYAPQPHAQPHIISQSPFGLAQHMSGQVDYGCSPHGTALGFTSPTTQAYPAVYGVTYKTAPHVEGPVHYTPLGNDSSASPDPQRPSHIGKVPTVKSKVARKMSMHDGRHNEQYVSSRPATVHGHARAMSQNDVFGPAPELSIDTSVQGNSSMAPHYTTGYNVPVPRSAGSWPGHGSMGSYYDGSVDQGVADSPVTPARPITSGVASDDSYKRQRRRECHNQVEKRRREHINTKIEELGRLLPPSLMDQGDGDEDEDHSRSKKKKKRSGPSAKKLLDNGQCKGTILSKTVQYLTDLSHKNDMLKARIQQLEAALGSSGPVANVSISNVQSYWNHTTPVRREVQYTTSPAAPASSYHPRYMVPDVENLEVMRPSPEPEALNDVPYNVSWNGQNMTSASGPAHNGGAASASVTPDQNAGHSDSTYTPDNETSTLHSSFSSHDSSPAGAGLELQPATSVKAVKYPLNNTMTAPNGLGLEFVPEPMEMQMGHMGWQ